MLLIHMEVKSSYRERRVKEGDAAALRKAGLGGINEVLNAPPLHRFRAAPHHFRVVELHSLHIHSGIGIG